MNFNFSKNKDGKFHFSFKFGIAGLIVGFIFQYIFWRGSEIAEMILHTIVLMVGIDIIFCIIMFIPMLLMLRTAKKDARCQPLYQSTNITPTCAVNTDLIIGNVLQYLMQCSEQHKTIDKLKVEELKQGYFIWITDEIYNIIPNDEDNYKNTIAATVINATNSSYKITAAVKSILSPDEIKRYQTREHNADFLQSHITESTIKDFDTTLAQCFAKYVSTSSTDLYVQYAKRWLAFCQQDYTANSIKIDSKDIKNSTVYEIIQYLRTTYFNEK